MPCSRHRLSSVGYRRIGTVRLSPADRSVPGHVMNFFCLVETETCSTPHLEWLPVDTLDEARDHARRALNQHLMPIAAHIYADDELFETIRPRDCLLPTHSGPRATKL